ncbi:hypothetical protein DRP04_07880 [Archaeoglobales archaeon]|nr:MAG: hypothetical protein DRP04_07880 [Archaeoglobales archaeon]
MEKEVVKKEVVKMEKLLKSLLIVFVITTGVLAGVTVEPLLQGKPTAITVDNAMFVGIILATIMTYLGGLLMGSVVEEDTGISAIERFLLFLSIIGILSFLIGMKIPTL